jgi:hypothetical protein
MSAAALDDEDTVKFVLMAVIDEGIRNRYPSLEAAAKTLGIGPDKLSRIRHCHYHRYSIAWLLRLANRVGVTVVIDARV